MDNASPLTIRALDIAGWADSVQARALLPVLVRRLVHEGSAALTAIDFPGHDEAQRHGWDGWTEAATGDAWVPAGATGWELSVANDNPSKPNRDWAQRSALPAVERAATAFAFVTARRWPGKTRWADARREENLWADVLAYDAEDLSQWVEQSPATRLWFARVLGRPVDGLRTLDDAWNAWASACRPILSTKLFDEAVAEAAGGLASWRSAAPHRPYVVTADSVGEAVAFTAAALDLAERERVIVVKNARALPGPLAAGGSGLIVIADPLAEAPAASAAHARHIVFARTHVAVPTDVDVALAPTSRAAFEAALADMGVPEHDRDRMTTEAGRSPTVLRRRLAIAPELRVPDWARDPVLQRKLMPILLAGAWRVGDPGDETCVADLAAKPIAAVERDVAELAALPDAPVWAVGGFRGVVSRKDALFAIHHAITEDDLHRFLTVAELVLTLDDPRLDLPEDQRWAAGMYGVQVEASGALREAVGDLLVLLAVEGDRLLGARLGPVAARVECLVARVLKDATPRRWLAMHHLRWLAEAAPDAFLDAVDADLRQQEPALFTLLRPVTSSMGRCERTELLWALELLAWEPRRFPRGVRDPCPAERGADRRQLGEQARSFACFAGALLAAADSCERGRADRGHAHLRRDALASRMETTARAAARTRSRQPQHAPALARGGLQCRRAANLWRGAHVRTRHHGSVGRVAKLYGRATRRRSERDRRVPGRGRRHLADPCRVLGRHGVGHGSRGLARAAATRPAAVATSTSGRG